MPIAVSRRKFRLISGLLALSLCSGVGRAEGDATDPELTAKIASLDSQVFGAYNQCDLDTFARYFAPNVEFYHDKGGVTWDRDTVVANTKKWICGKVRRELLPETLRIYPIKDFGAIEEGEHQFCQTAHNMCEGAAKFLMIWRKEDGRWVITRVISYGHRALAVPVK